MKRFIVTEAQLNEYVSNKIADKTFYEIMEKLHNNVKFLNESVSHNKANQSIIDDYRRKNLITSKVHEMLIKNHIVNENYEII